MAEARIGGERMPQKVVEQVGGIKTGEATAGFSVVNKLKHLTPIVGMHISEQRVIIGDLQQSTKGILAQDMPEAVQSGGIEVNTDNPIQSKEPIPLADTENETEKFSMKSKTPEEWKEWLKSPKVDGEIFDAIYSIRDELEKGYETAEGWKEVKALARKEIEQLPADVIDTLYDRFIPFVEELPSGHGVGHFARDLVNFTLLMQDPEAKRLYGDDVEVTVGAFAGLFHDIGNSVVKRYDDAVRSAGHAEVGAYLFGKVAKDIIPVNLMKLVQYSIAAHTHYPKDANKPDSNGKLKRAYAGRDGIVEEDGQRHRLAVWLVRQTDRQDLLQDVPILVRHMETKAVPTVDYAEGGYHEPEASELADFKFQFTPALIKKEGNKINSIDINNPSNTSVGDVTGTPDVLAHILGLSQSAFAENIYTQYDSVWFKSLAKEGGLGTKEFIRAVIGSNETLIEVDINQSFDNFYTMCRIIDPGRDLDTDVIRLFKEKFSTLPQEDQRKWARGFQLLSTVLWRNWFDRTNTILNASQVENMTSNQKVNSLLGSIQKGAQEVMKEFDPIKLNKPSA